MTGTRRRRHHTSRTAAGLPPGPSPAAGAGAITARRKLEDVIETVELPLPCLVAVTPDIALPRIPGMGDILKAGKKPMEVSAATGAYANVTETISVKAPEQVDRKLDVKDASEDGAIEAFAAAIKAAR